MPSQTRLLTAPCTMPQDPGTQQEMGFVVLSSIGETLRLQSEQRHNNMSCAAIVRPVAGLLINGMMGNRAAKYGANANRFAIEQQFRP